MSKVLKQVLAMLLFSILLLQPLSVFAATEEANPSQQTEAQDSANDGDSGDVDDGTDGDTGAAGDEADSDGSDSDKKDSDEKDDEEDENHFEPTFPTFTLESDNHIRYLFGNDDGFFYPDRSMSRAEVAQVFYRLVVEDLPHVEEDQFTDIEEKGWYKNVVNTLGAAGVLEGYKDGTFKPARRIKRSEFVVLLSRFFEVDQVYSHPFSDVRANSWAEPQIAFAYHNGWIEGYTATTFKPNNEITRAEAIAIINRALDRSPDFARILTDDMRVFPDVNLNHWAYYDIYEAFVDHKYWVNDEGTEIWLDIEKPRSILPAGFHLVKGQLYHLMENGNFTHDAYVNTLYFNAKCAFSTKNDELDAYLLEIAAEHTHKTNPKEDNLRYLYNYVVDNFSYLQRPLLSNNAFNWEAERALHMFETHKGNCYDFAAVFYFLARKAGYNANTRIGWIDDHNSPHSWVEISIDNVTYIFDPQMEMNEHQKGNYSDSFFKLRYDEAKRRYITA